MKVELGHWQRKEKPLLAAKKNECFRAWYSGDMGESEKRSLK